MSKTTILRLPNDMRSATFLFLLTGIFLVPSYSAVAQVSDALFPGGTTPGTTAAIFAPELISSTAQEYGVAVTHDWSEIYFTRLNGEQSDVMVTHRSGTTWSDPVRASFSDSNNDSRCFSKEAHSFRCGRNWFDG